MNKYIEHYKSKYKPLIERLSEPKTIAVSRRNLLITGFIFAAYGLGLFQTGYNLAVNSPKQKKEGISQEDKTYFGYFSRTMALGNTYVTNQKEENIEIKALLEESINGHEAMRFAQNIVEDAYISYPERKYKTLESKIDLAKKVMKQARTELQLVTAGGKGNYTQKYEVGDSKDSRQTFDEFYGPKDGKEFTGDCDDFSIALTTTYHTIRDYAEDNKTKDPFFKALAEGLESYKIYSVLLLRHVVNIGMTIKDNKVAEVEAIEPQIVNSKIKLKIRKKQILIEYYNEKSEKVTDRIWGLYGRGISAYPKR